jgi:coproporphyrinogen III oxidase
MKEQFYSYIQNLQDQIVAGLEAVDGQAKFRSFGIVRKVEGRTSNREWRSIRKRRSEYICCSWEIAGQHAKAI